MMLLSKVIAKLQKIFKKIGDVETELYGRDDLGYLTYNSDFSLEPIEANLYVLEGKSNLVECPCGCGWEGDLSNCYHIKNRFYCIKCGGLIIEYNPEDELSFDFNDYID